MEFDLSCERAVVIGNGNVAADVARMLALTRDELDTTDTADHAIEPLAESAVREIVVLGRRGPAQAAFTNPELRELGEMADADIVVDPAELELDELSRAYLENEADITARKNVEILDRVRRASSPRASRKRIVLRFLGSPIEIQGDGRVERVVVGRNELHRDDSGAIRPRDTGERETIEGGLVLRSIGYKGIAIEGIPFDERRGVIPNEGGRVTDPEGGGQVPGQYAVGWIKRGPSGRDRHEQEGRPGDGRQARRGPGGGAGSRARADPEPAAIEALLRERRPDHVTYQGWEAIDRAESRARQAPRPPAGQVLPHRRDARGRFPRPDPVAG